ncbi:MAG: HAD family hydrolase [Thermoplasmata archaeon]|nr:MAG: HAD family hydrolase [Thermoplasmata archaeon]
MKILALDFDGVLCDSVNECLINSYNSFNIIDNMPTKKVYSLKMLVTSEVETFTKFRPLVRVAREYYALWYLIKKNQPIDPYKNIREQIKISDYKLDVFNTIFLQQRREWMGKDIRSWLSHNPLYAGINEVLIKIFKRENVFIVSSKNKSAISAILENNGISIGKDKIWGADCNMDKVYVLNRFKEKYAISFSDIIFLDDNIYDLLKAKELGILGFCALWGYSLVNEKKRIRDNGIPVIALEDFGDWAKNILDKESFSSCAVD